MPDVTHSSMRRPRMPSGPITLSRVDRSRPQGVSGGEPTPIGPRPHAPEGRCPGPLESTRRERAGMPEARAGTNGHCGTARYLSDAMSVMDIFLACIVPSRSPEWISGENRPAMSVWRSQATLGHPCKQHRLFQGRDMKLRPSHRLARSALMIMAAAGLAAGTSAASADDVNISFIVKDMTNPY